MKESSSSLPVQLGVLVLAAGGAAALLHRGELADQFSFLVTQITSWPQFWLLYFGCEMVGIPSLPLALSAGALFGPPPAVALVSSAGIVSAAAAFLAARYLARERVVKFMEGNDKFAIIDRALARPSTAFRIMLLLRIAPIFPFSVSNYLYGTTQIPFKEYIAATFLGLLPSTVIYTMSGSAGAGVFASGGISTDNALSVGGPVAGGVLLAVASAGFVARMLQDAIREAEEEAEDEGKGQ